MLKSDGTNNIIIIRHIYLNENEMYIINLKKLL